jgi:alpha-1,3-glucan synthase
MTVLDPHYGTINDWVEAINEIHARGMYFMADLTVGTMADLLGFKGFLNSSAPFSVDEYEVEYTYPNYIPWNFSEYRDFSVVNTKNNSCVYPTFYDDDSSVIPQSEVGATYCMESDFDQYGDMEAFGVHPDWQVCYSFLPKDRS